MLQLRKVREAAACANVVKISLSAWDQASYGWVNRLHIQANQATIFSMLQRRPCTAEQIADIFGMHLNEVSKYLGRLMRADQIRAQRERATVYYAATDRKDKGGG